MPQTRDVGRFFAHTFTYPLKGAPLVERAETVEVEPPYRLGKGISVRLWGRRALILGRWGKTTRAEAEALYEALKASDMDVCAREIETWGAPAPEETSWQF